MIIKSGMYPCLVHCRYPSSFIIFGYQKGAFPFYRCFRYHFNTSEGKGKATATQFMLEKVLFSTVQHGSSWGCPEGGYKKGGLPGMAAKMKGKAT
jgi:hypothetical protein